MMVIKGFCMAGSTTKDFEFLMKVGGSERGSNLRYIRILNGGPGPPEA